MRIVHPAPLPPFEEFREQFRAAFGRELTREERRFYRLIDIVLQEAQCLGSYAAEPKLKLG
jgi:hypothetical protein